MRVVFDTNILVSALVLPGGSADKAVARIIDGRDLVLFSRETLDKLLGVLARKFGRDREELARVAVFIDELGQRVRPRARLNVLSDEADNRILECAVAGHAEAVVTGDRGILKLESYERIPIMSLRAYLSSL